MTRLHLRMIKTLSLVLPVLIPSWRFFKTIEPSPRIQWSRVNGAGEPFNDWQEFKPRPDVISPLQMFCRLFWNPDWNDTLFLVSCAERIQQTSSDHSIREIRKRIAASQARSSDGNSRENNLRFRLVFVQRQGTGFSQDVVFLSDVFPSDKVSGP